MPPLDIPADDPLAVALMSAIRSGDVPQLERLLQHDPALAAARIVDDKLVRRSLLHIVTDWPGHFPEGARTAALLVRYGADVNASVNHPTAPSAETPLHWAASCDDVPLIDALLDAGADIEAPGAIFTDGAPMSDAVVFAQWNAAGRLLERGAQTTFWQSAALGLLDNVRSHFDTASQPSEEEITNALWHACRGGQREVAEFLVARGADPNWIGYDDKTPLQLAEESGNHELADWLRRNG
jgi:ankyrin repeat protein